MAMLHQAKQLVIKVGSSLLLDSNGEVNLAWLDAFAQDIAALHAQGTRIIIVTSGAVALGRTTLGHKKGILKLEEKQAAAACGQIKLVEAWQKSLGKHGIAIAQILLTIDDSEDRTRYLNARNTLSTLLNHNIIPIINENDTVATAELRVGDNDRLSARVAQMVGADYLILFSDIDGLYTKNPHQDKTAEFISQVKDITPAIEAMAGSSSSGVGTGGMITKIEAAKIAVAAGCTMVIALGKNAHPLQTLLETAHGTWFLAHSNPVNARKNWIMGAISPSGILLVDKGAETALRAGKSLLPAGILQVQGAFAQGDCLLVKNEAGQVIARGLVNYAAEEAERIRGQKSQAIESILGYEGRHEIIHRDNLVLAG